jgi:hypothetical protein
MDHHIYAVDATTGEECWRFRIGDQQAASAVKVDGKASSASDDGGGHASAGGARSVAGNLARSSMPARRRLRATTAGAVAGQPWSRAGYQRPPAGGANASLVLADARWIMGISKHESHCRTLVGTSQRPVAILAEQGRTLRENSDEVDVRHETVR